MTIKVAIALNTKVLQLTTFQNERTSKTVKLNVNRHYLVSQNEVNVTK